MSSINNNSNFLNSNSNKILSKNSLYNQYRKNVNIDYIFCFLKNFDISSAIWVLYMVYKGLPLWQIGIVEGIFHVCSFIFEVPSGAIADLFGRKNTIIAGRILSIVSAVINLFANNIVMFSFSFVISALSYNLNSGSEEALVYDSLKKINNEDKYIKVNSKLNMIIEVAQSLGTFAGGILAEYSYVLCYSAVIVVSFISIIPAILFTEPSIINSNTSDNIEPTESSTLRMHFKTCIKIISSNAEIIN